LELPENIIEAQYSQKKHHFLRKTNIILEKLRLMVRLSKDLQCITINEYEYLAKEINEIGKMVGGWEKYSKSREYGKKVQYIDFKQQIMIKYKYTFLQAIYTAYCRSCFVVAFF